MTSDQERLEQAIAALELQRAILGDVVVDTAVAGMRQQLDALKARDAPVHQRKLISIMFADIVGSTQIGERFDPEVVMEIMEGALLRFAEAVKNSGGRVTRFMGDGFQALFGAPVSHENDARQAVRAGLAVLEAADDYAKRAQSAWGIEDFKVRVGINTGLVALGGSTEADKTVMGTTVNLASRMESAAPPGGLLISHNTYQHIRHAFDVKPLEPVQAKGIAEPVPVYLVTGEKPQTFHLVGRDVGEVQAPMVGRESELASLKGTLRDVMREKQSQVITICGDAGIGKSRLILEFDNWVGALPRATRFQGRARLETRNSPYALVRDLFASSFQIKDSDDVAVAKKKFEAGIEDVLGAGSGTKPKAHFMGRLVGFDFAGSPYLKGMRDAGLEGDFDGGDARQLRDRALSYLVEFFRATANSRSTVILLRDIQWADDSSLDALEHLSQSVPDREVLVVCTARSTLFERRPDWGQKSFHRILQLRPLSAEHSRCLISELLCKVSHIPATLCDLIVGNAEGNPFYMEELSRNLIDDGVIITEDAQWHVDSNRLHRVHIPETLMGILQARLDSLHPAHKDYLQRASVVGRTFWDEAVAHLNERSEILADPVQALGTLSALQRKEMILPNDPSTFESSQEFTFKQSVLHQVTYESVLMRVRQKQHALVANWLEAKAGKRLGEFRGVIAEHLAHAGEKKRAAQMFAEAGVEAATRFANAEAVHYFSQALELISDADSEERLEILFARERIYDLQGARQEQAQDLAELIRMADDTADPLLRARVALRQARFAEATSDFPAIISAASHAIKLVEMGATSDRAFARCSAAGYRWWGAALLRMGNYVEARARFDKALSLARNAKSLRDEADCLRDLGIASRNQGDLESATAFYEAALPLYHRINDKRGESKTLNSLGSLQHDLGNMVEARDYFEKALGLKHEIGDRSGESGVLNNLGLALQHLGDYGRARDSYRRALALKDEIGDRRGESLVLCNMGLLCHQLREDEDSNRYSQHALFISRELGDRSNEGYALTYIGHAQARMGYLAEAVSAYEQALVIRRELGQEALAVECQASLARVFQMQGNVTRAESTIAQVIEFLDRKELVGTDEPFRIYLSCYRILRTDGSKRGWIVLKDAYEQLQQRAAKLSDEDLRHSFLYDVSAHRDIIYEYEGTSNQEIV